MSGALQPVELVPLILGLGAATGFLGLAIGFWILYIGLGLTAYRPGPDCDRPDRLGVRIQRESRPLILSACTTAAALRKMVR